MELVLWHLYFFFKIVIAVDTATTIFKKISQPWIQRRLGMDTATARRGYSDGPAWIHRRPGVDTETGRRGYRDGQAWIQRRPGVDTETSRRGYSDGLDI